MGLTRQAIRNRLYGMKKEKKKAKISRKRPRGTPKKHVGLVIMSNFDSSPLQIQGHHKVVSNVKNMPKIW